MKRIIQALDKYYQLSDEAKCLLTDKLESFSIKKGEELIPELHISKYVYFIEEGALKNHFIDKEGNKNVVWFGFEGDVCFSFCAYFDIPYYHECIEAIEDSVLYRVELDYFRQLQLKNIDWCNWGRFLVEHHFVQLCLEQDEHRPKSAKEKYLHLIDNNPNILKRVPLKDIASYLGVSPVTISRFRSEKR